MRQSSASDEIFTWGWRAVVRRLVQKPPDGGVKTLVRYLPNAEDESVEEEVYFGIYAIAAKAKSIDATLEAVLTDKLGARGPH